MKASPAITEGSAPQGALAFLPGSLSAADYVRPMRGGSQAHMLIANNGNAYITKTINNPQSPRVLANEWLASRIGREIGLSIPAPAIVQISAEFIQANPQMVIRQAGQTIPCAAGPAFGSCVPVDPQQPIHDYLPEPALATVENVMDYAGCLLLDKWLCNCDGRQAIYCRHPNGRMRVYFIDHGFCFDAEDWDFPDSPLRGVYMRNCVYAHITSWQSFEPWLSRIECFPLPLLESIAAEMPAEWMPSTDALRRLILAIHDRRRSVRNLIMAVKNSPRRPFSNWIETASET